MREEKPLKNRPFFTFSLPEMSPQKKTQKFHLQGLADQKTFHLSQKPGKSVKK